MQKPVVFPPLGPEEERRASSKIGAGGFHFRPPPEPSALRSFITPDSSLFETIHMGAATVDEDAWRLQVDGMVHKPFSVDLAGLRQFPRHTVTAFHECYGSPLKPPVENLSRIGNVRWTGVRLSTLLGIAELQTDAAYIWSDGLDRGEYGGKSMDRYRKDLPLEKALRDEVLVADEINGEPLRKERGGPVRLVVPGWFGTNMTKWLCRISVQRDRANSPFTTDWYNEEVTVDGVLTRKPVWSVAPNSIVVEPQSGQTVTGRTISVNGWAWAGDGVALVKVSGDGGKSWVGATVEPRVEFEWQKFHCTIQIDPEHPVVIARATDFSGNAQPLSNYRNAVLPITLRVDL